MCVCVFFAFRFSSFTRWQFLQLDILEDVKTTIDGSMSRRRFCWLAMNESSWWSVPTPDVYDIEHGLYLIIFNGSDKITGLYFIISNFARV